MVERQQVDKGAETQSLGALAQCGEEEPRRGGAAERRRVVLGEVISVDASCVIGLGQVEPVGVELCERAARIVHVVEHAEFHGECPATAPCPLSGRPPG